MTEWAVTGDERPESWWQRDALENTSPLYGWSRNTDDGSITIWTADHEGDYVLVLVYPDGEEDVL